MRKKTPTPDPAAALAKGREFLSPPPGRQVGRPRRFNFACLAMGDVAAVPSTTPTLRSAISAAAVAWRTHHDPDFYVSTSVVSTTHGEVVVVTRTPRPQPRDLNLTDAPTPTRPKRGVNLRVMTPEEVERLMEAQRRPRDLFPEPPAAGAPGTGFND